MSRTLLVVGTRKGCFLLESDEARRDWEVRGPFCEGWPIYHAVIDPGSGDDLRGSRQRMARLGRLAEHGPRRDLDALERRPRLRRGRRTEGLEGLEPLSRTRPGARRRRGARDLREPRRRRHLVAPLDARRRARAAKCGTILRTSLLGHLGLSALLADPAEPDRFWAIVQGIGLFETTDDGATWTPRNRGLRADWPRPHEEVGFCVHKVVRSTADGDRMYQQNHVGMHRSDDCGQTWTEITEGLPTEFGFAAATHPARPRHLLRRCRSTPGTVARCPTARLRSGARATVARAGSEPTTACRNATRTSVCCARRWRTTPTTLPGYYFGTSTGQLFASADDAEIVERDRELPARRSRRSRSRCSTDAMAELHLPMTLTPLFPELPRRIDAGGGDGRRGDRPARRALAGRARPALRAGPGDPAAHSRLRRP